MKKVLRWLGIIAICFVGLLIILSLVMGDANKAAGAMGVLSALVLVIGVPIGVVVLIIRTLQKRKVSEEQD